jgi:superfamily I DNA/RNA helicase
MSSSLRRGASLATLLARQRAALRSALAAAAGGAGGGLPVTTMAATTATATTTTTTLLATPPPPPPPLPASSSSPTAHLNPEQLAAALSPARAVRVIAGPGSGKTATLTARCAALVLGDGGAATTATTTATTTTTQTTAVPAWQLLVITFTNKAAGELKRRLAGALGEDRARQVAAGTFHSLSARLLRRYASRLAEVPGDGSAPSGRPPRWASLRPDFGVYDEGDASDVLERALKQLLPDPLRPKPAELRWLISQVKSHCPRGAYGVSGREAVARAAAASAPLARALSSSSFPSSPGSSSNSGELSLEPRRAELLAEAFDAYADALDADGALDFDDLLGACVALLERAPGVREELHRRWRHVLVDEFQDTNAPQYRLVQLLLSPDPSARLFCVGDPCQGVYSFRGADPSNLARAFERDFGGGGGMGVGAGVRAGSDNQAASVATLALRRNHRSVDPIVRAAERVLCGCGLAPGLHSAAETVRRTAALPPAPPPSLPPPGLAPGERYRVPIDAGAAALLSGGSRPSFTAAPVTLVEASTGAGEVAAVVRAAKAWREAGGALSEFAVLYRYRAQARDLEEALAEAGVPCIVHGGTALWARREVRDALALLRLAARASAGEGEGEGGDEDGSSKQQAGDSQALRRVLTGIDGLALTAGLGPKAVASLQQAADDAGISLAALVLDGCCDGDAAAASASPAASLARLLWDDLERSAAAAAAAAAARASAKRSSSSSAARSPPPPPPPPIGPPPLDPADVAARLESAAPPPPAPVAAALRTAAQRAAIARVRGLVAVVRAALEGHQEGSFPLAPDEALDLALHAAGYHAWLAILREKERKAAAKAAGGGAATAAAAASLSSSSNGSRERSLDVLGSLARNPETYAQAAEQELFFFDEQGLSSSPPPAPWEDEGAATPPTALPPPPSSSSSPAVSRGLDALVAFVDFAALMSDPHNDTPDDDGDEEEEDEEEDEEASTLAPRDVIDAARRRRLKQQKKQRNTESRVRRAEQRDAVQLMTLHASKGREFAHVAMVGVEEGTLPALPPGDAVPLRAGEDAWEEEKRLCYVGMTRARDYLMVSWARARRAWGADGARLLRAASAAAAAAASGDGGDTKGAAARPPSPYGGGGGLIPVEQSPFVVALLQGAKSGALKGVEVVRAPSAGAEAWSAGGGSGGGGSRNGARSRGVAAWREKKKRQQQSQQQQQRRGVPSSSAAYPTSSPSPAPPPLPPKPGVAGAADNMPPPRRSARLRRKAPGGDEDNN